MVFTRWNKFQSFAEKKKPKYSVYFMRLTLSRRSFIKIQYSSFPLFPVAYLFRIATHLQYHVKREKCKVNDVIFPSGCEARSINLGNKNVKIGIFTGGTSVRSKNIFTDISRYPYGKYEISSNIWRTSPDKKTQWQTHFVMITVRWQRHSAYLGGWKQSYPSAVTAGVIYIRSMHNRKYTALHTSPLEFFFVLLGLFSHTIR